jgi:chromosome segregation ATPase
MEVMLVATRKKKGDGDASDVARGFVVVIEEMRGQFRAFGEKLTALDDRVTAGFAEMGDRLGRVEHGLARVERRVGQLEERVGQLEVRVGQLEVRVGQLEERVGHVEVRLGQVEVAILETRHDRKKKVDRDEVGGIVEGVLARKARR